MNPEGKAAIIGAIAGAVTAAIMMVGVAGFGYLPGSDSHIHDYLMAHPQLVADMSNKLQEDQNAGQETAQRNAMKKLGLTPFFDPKVAFVTGPANAKTTLVEFYDYDCPYCRASLPAVKKFYEAHKGDTRFAFIELPIPSLHGPSAVLAARASLAARRQPEKYLALHFALMGQEHPVDEASVFNVAQSVGLDMNKLRADMQRPEVDAAINTAHNLAVATSIDGTPAFIFNGTIREGAVDDATLAHMLDGHS